MRFIFSKYLAFSILLLSFATDNFSQTRQVKFNLVTGTNGVSLGKINGMTRDKQGFMWFSDQTNRCIIRFDGGHMTKFQNDPKNENSLGGYYPECLATDSSGNIWIGFYGMGLDKFEPVTGRFTHYRHQKGDPESLSDDFVSTVLVDHFGNVWAGSRGGLDMLDQKTGKFKHYRNKPGDASSLSHDQVRALYEDKSGELWVGTGFNWDDDQEGGLNRFHRNTGTFTRYLHDPSNPNSLSDNKVRAIFEDSYGNFWIGTRGNGLHTLDKKTGLITRHPYNSSSASGQPGPPAPRTADDNITFITEDADREIWIGTMLSGIIRYDPLSKQTTHYRTNNDKTGLINDTTSWWAHASPDGIVWISTQNSNLFRIDIYNVIIPGFEVNSRNGVLAFNEEPASVLWLGTNNGLLRKNTKNGTVSRFVNEPGNPNSLSGNNMGGNLVTKIIKDKKGNFWIGTDNAINHYNLKTGNFTRYYHYSGSNITARILDLCEDADSNIWVGTFGRGLKMLNPETGKFTDYRSDPSNINTISNDVVTSLLEDGASILWTGNANNGGVNKLDRKTGKFTRYLPGLTVTCIYKDADDIIWIGATGGLYRYDKPSDRFNSFGEENAGNDIVEIESMVADNENNLWIATETGIYMLNKKRDRLMRYGQENGLRDANNTFNWGAAFKKQDGELYFGNDGGYYAFYPDQLKATPFSNQLYLTGLWLNNQEIKPGSTGLLRESLNLAKEIRLRHNQNVFSISATVIDFRSSSDKRIYYKLENYDDSWRSAGPEDQLHYFKVPPGKYVFHIKAANTSDGEWQEKSIDIIILPPWWATWWAYIIYALLFLAAVFLIYRFQKERLIKAENERARIKELAYAKEIEKAYHELKATQQQLIQSEKMASLGELTAGIAHEIQNPLNFVNNFSELNKELLTEMNDEIEKGNYNDVKAIAKDVIDNQEKINHHGKRADAIVKGMLQHSRSSSGMKEPTDINALADEYLRLAYHGLRAKDNSFNATIKTDFDQSIGTINIIPQDIGRVILNLLTNAFYAASLPSKGGFSDSDVRGEPTVWVSTKKGSGNVLISVRDNGPGIPQKVLDKIFQPFFTTKPTGQGTGLGLSLSYDIVKAHGGELKVDTREGEWTEFIIQLPNA